MGVLSWLRQFFYSDDELVKLAGALTEPEIELRSELLANEGIVSMIKNKSSLSHMWGSTALPFENSHDLFVRQSDLARARQVLEPFTEQPDADEAQQGSWFSRGRE